MADDVLHNKAATIEHCIRRAEEEYRKAPSTFAQDFTRQDAATLNLQRACRAALGMGQYVVRRDGLGVPQNSRDVFELLDTAGRLPRPLAQAMKKMVGFFRNIAVHEYQKVQLPITIAIITQHLGDFRVFSQAPLVA